MDPEKAVARKKFSMGMLETDMKRWMFKEKKEN